MIDIKNIKLQNIKRILQRNLVDNQDVSTDIVTKVQVGFNKYYAGEHNIIILIGV